MIRIKVLLLSCFLLGIASCGGSEEEVMRYEPILQDGMWIPEDSVAHAISVSCEGMTQKGTRCKRMAMRNSVYCWQHAPESTQVQQSTPSSTPSHNIQTGPRGGQYYINKNGKKTYIKKK